MPRPRFALPMLSRQSRRSVIPGLRLSLGLTLLYLGLIVLLPIGALLLKAADVGFERYIAIITSPRTLASFQVTLTTAALAALFAKNGWFGAPLAQWGIQVAYAPAGIVCAMAFTSIPFVVRTVQPVLEDMEPELEEAGATLGASDLTIFRRIIFPAIFPAFLAGTSLAFARSLGEFGAVVFIAGNQPFRTEIVALLTFIRLEEYDYAAAAAIAVTMLGLAFLMLLIVNAVQAWHQKFAMGDA